MPASPRRITIALATAAALTAMASCRGATEVLVDVRTNAAYRDGLVVSFTVGTPGEVESAAPTTEQRGPWGANGFVGSLAVVPSSGSNKDTALGVKIVMGIDRDARTCTPPDYRGCIVARRRLHYTPHERLVLPIALYVECKDVPCDVESTCNALGQCVDAALDPVTCQSATGCELPGDVGSGGTMVTDGSFAEVPDGPSSGDGAVDGPPPPDAQVDSPREAGRGGTPGQIECGKVVCDATIGDHCCYDAQVLVGSCAPAAAECAVAENLYSWRCDGSEDCPQSCCAVGNNTVCASSCVPAYPEVCESGAACAAGTSCIGTVSGGNYRSCQ